MDKLFKLLKANKSLKKFVNEIDISNTIKNNWGVIFGKLAKDLEFGFYRGGILQVEARNYLWVNEISYYKKQILKLANETVGKKSAIKDIRVVKSVANYKKKKEISSIKIDKNLSFEEKIKESNKRKRDSGFCLCEKCSDVLTDTKVCVFCRNKKE
jgi:hypothetical protein